MSGFEWFLIGFALGGVLIAVILNNMHSSKVKALEAKYATDLAAAVKKAGGSL